MVRCLRCFSAALRAAAPRASLAFLAAEAPAGLAWPLPGWPFGWVVVWPLGWPLDLGAVVVAAFRSRSPRSREDGFRGSAMVRLQRVGISRALAQRQPTGAGARAAGAPP